MLNKKIIYIFAPHPDDETFACGGLIVKKLSESYQVKVVIISNGDKSHRHYHHVQLKNLAKTRAQESISALNILGVNINDIIFLHYKDKSISLNKKPITKKILPIILADFSLIKEIYFPHICSKHIDHRASSEIIHQLLKSVEYIGLRYLYIIWEDDQYPIIGKKIVQDITSQLELKKLAINEYKSQISCIIPKQLKPILSPAFINKRLQPIETFFLYKDKDFERIIQLKNKSIKPLQKKQLQNIPKSKKFYKQAKLFYQSKDITIGIIANNQQSSFHVLADLLLISPLKKLENKIQFIFIFDHSHLSLDEIKEIVALDYYDRIPILVISNKLNISSLNKCCPVLFYLNLKQFKIANRECFWQDILKITQSNLKISLKNRPVLSLNIIEIFQYFSFDTKKGGVYDICYHQKNSIEPLLITKHVKSKYLDNSPLKPNQERWCKKIISSLNEQGKYRLFHHIISTLEKLPHIGKHLINAISIDQDGGYEIRYIEGINLSSIEKLNLLPISQLSKLFDAINILKISLQQYVANNTLSGDWGLQNLIFSFSDNIIYNIDNEGFYTYPLIHHSSNNNNYSFIIDNLNNLTNQLSNNFKIEKSQFNFPNSLFFKQYYILKTLTHNKKRATFIIRSKNNSDQLFFLKNIKQSINVNINNEIFNAISLNNTHNNINLLQIHITLDGMFLLFKYKQALDLETYIKRHGVLSEQELLQLLEEMINILAIYKRKKILHLDLKPANILYDGKHFNLIDLGSSISCSEHKTQYLNFNKYFLPPEIYTGCRTFSSEVYQLACIIFYASKGNITNLFGISKASIDQIIFAHLFINPKLPKYSSLHLEYILPKMLLKPPLDRITIEEIKQALKISKKDINQLKTKQAEENIRLPESIKEIYQFLVDKNIAFGEYQTGMFYLQGNYFTQNTHTAKRYLELASNKGLGCAQYELGLLTLKSAKNETEIIKAYDWIHKSSKNNYNKAHYMIAQILSEQQPHSTQFFPQQPNYWFKKAAIEGYLPAYKYFGKNELNLFINTINTSDLKISYQDNNNLNFNILDHI